MIDNVIDQKYQFPISSDAVSVYSNDGYGIEMFAFDENRFNETGQ